jgi:hypothetical protein
VSPLLVEPLAGAQIAATGAVVSVPVQNPEPPPGQGEEFGKASPIALVVIILLALATVVLIRSMTKRIRRLPTTFDQPAEPVEPPAEQQPTGRDTEDAGRDSS